MIHVVTDTTSGLPADLARRYDIPVIPQVVIFGDESYLEGVEMDHATFLGRLRTAKTLPKTAAPSPGLFTDLFRQRVRPGDTVLCIHPSAELSGTVRSALTAAADFPDLDIRVLDTRTVASPLAALALLAGWRQWRGGWFAALAMAGLLYLLGIVVFTAQVNLPLNHYTESWDPAALPADWAATRERWNAANLWRTGASAAAFALALAALVWLRATPPRRPPAPA